MSLKVHYPKKAVIQWLNDRYPETNWESVLDEGPPVIWRHRWNHLAEKYGLPHTQKYLQNLDSKGIGPSAYC